MVDKHRSNHPKNDQLRNGFEGWVVVYGFNKNIPETTVIARTRAASQRGPQAGALAGSKGQALPVGIRKAGGRKKPECLENKDYELTRHMATTVFLRIMGTKDLREPSVNCLYINQAGTGRWDPCSSLHMR